MVRRIAALLIAALAVYAQTENKPERLEWFRDQGFGPFFHWTMDSQIGVVESHDGRSVGRLSEPLCE
jgi:hypothetical protein